MGWGLLLPNSFILLRLRLQHPYLDNYYPYYQQNYYPSYDDQYNGNSVYYYYLE